MTWQVACAAGDKTILGETPRVSGTLPWTDFEIEFEVPQSNCRAQWLRLRLAARTALEQQIGGEVFYDDIRIRRDAPG